MLPWDVPDDELSSIVQFMKTFSPRWKTEKAGTPVTVVPDPWRERPAIEAVSRGRTLYHASMKCVTCHPSHVPAEEITAMRLSVGMPTELRKDIDSAVTGESAYGAIKATNLGDDSMRAGTSPEDIYRSVAAGVGGTAMPAWFGQVSDEDLWAVVHYVRSLRE